MAGLHHSVDEALQCLYSAGLHLQASQRLSAASLVLSLAINLAQVSRAGLQCAAMTIFVPT